jgi:hypothetical protein
VQSLVDQKFEESFAQIEKASTESKKFAADTLVKPLQTLLQGSPTESEKFHAEQDLLRAVLKGDAIYSATKSFSFQPQSDGEAKALVAWDGIVRAVYGRLNRDWPARKESK